MRLFVLFLNCKLNDTSIRIDFGHLSIFLEYLSERLDQLLDDLHSQVLNEDFDHIENYLNNQKEQQNSSTNINEYNTNFKLTFVYMHTKKSGHKLSN